MDGLECNELLLSQIYNFNPINRIDSEFFIKRDIVIDTKIRQMPHFTFDASQVVSGPFGSTLKSEAYLPTGEVAFVRIENIKHGFFVDTREIVYINEVDNKRIKNSELSVDDLILSKVGNTIGYFARVDEAIGRCNISENNIGIKLGDIPKEKKHFILAYLNTTLAKTQVIRRTSGNAQPKLNVGDICYIPIPKFTNKLYLNISKTIELSFLNIKSSIEKYNTAGTLLLAHLELNDYTPNPSGVAVKTLSQSFGASGRLDSEYYQPKYEEIMQAISVHRKKSLSGDNGLVDIKKSIEPGSDFYGDVGVPFVRVSNLSKYELSEPDIRIPIDTIDGMEKLYPKKDTILLSKDGSVGIAYKVEQDLHCVTSGAILHLTIRDTAEILPDFLTLVLNSKVVQMQAERDAGGSIIQHWKPSEIAEVVIPVLDMGKQLEISDKLQESFALRKKSAELLELAKTAVEVAIEQGEEKALAMLEEVTL